MQPERNKKNMEKKIEVFLSPSLSGGRARKNFMSLGPNACVLLLVSIFGKRVLSKDVVGNTLADGKIPRHASFLQIECRVGKGAPFLSTLILEWMFNGHLKKRFWKTQRASHKSSHTVSPHCMHSCHFSTTEHTRPKKAHAPPTVSHLVLPYIEQGLEFLFFFLTELL